MVDIEQIETLHNKGIVTYAGVKRAKIINRFFELRKSGKPKMDCYIKISDEFYCNESYARKIVNEFNKK